MPGYSPKDAQDTGQEFHFDRSGVLKPRYAGREDLASLLLTGHTGGHGYHGEIDPESMQPGAFDLPLSRGPNEEFGLLRRSPGRFDIEALEREMGIRPAPGTDWNLPQPSGPRTRDLADPRRNITNGRFSSRGWHNKKLRRGAE